MNEKRRRFLQGMCVAVCLIASGNFLAGCGVAIATWITLGTSLLSTVIPMIPGIVAAIGSLLGKTLTAMQVAMLNMIFNGVGDLFKQIQQVFMQYQINNDPTLLTKIRDLVMQVRMRLANVIMDVGVTDPATVAKITSIVNGFLDLASNILNILPVVSGGVITARKVSKVDLARVQPANWAARFNVAVQKPSGNPIVDEAFKKVVAVPVVK